MKVNDEQRTAMNVIRNDWWATPVWEVHTEFDDVFNQQLLDEVSDYYNSVADNPVKNIWDSTGPCVKQLNDFILTTVKDATYNELVEDFSDPNLNFYNVCAWLNYKPPGANDLIHDHSGRKLTATYYINIPENSGDLLLIDPRGGADWGVVGGKKFKRYKPTKGKLVFFPGYLIHTVETNQSSQARISLTADIVVMPDRFINYIKSIV